MVQSSSSENPAQRLPLMASLLMAGLLLMAVALAGCAQSPAGAPNSSAEVGAPAPAPSDNAGVPAVSPPASGSNPSDNSGTPVVSPPAPSNPSDNLSAGGVVAENKTGFEKNQTLIVQAIADGTYANSATYISPGGPDELTISVTVQDDVITAVSLTPIQADPKSTMYINNFNKNIQPLAVGKKINELNLPKNVAGSSLTNGAFQRYVADIIEKY